MDVDSYRRDDHPSPYAPPDGLDDETVAEVSIPVENTDGQVLLISEATDAVWPSAKLHRVAADQIECSTTLSADII